MKREPCPYCGIDAGTGPWAHAKPELCIRALKDRELEARTCLQLLFMRSNKVSRERAWKYLYSTMSEKRIV